MDNFDNNLTKYDEKIDKYNKLIIDQKNEINKTGKLIIDFQTCLTQQNEALIGFIAEKELLISEKKKWYESSKGTIDSSKEEIKKDDKIVPVINQTTDNEIKTLNGDIEKSTENESIKRNIPNIKNAINSEKVTVINQPKTNEIKPMNGEINDTTKSEGIKGNIQNVESAIDFEKVPVISLKTNNEVKTMAVDINKTMESKGIKRKISNVESAIDSKKSFMDKKILKIRVEKIKISEIKNNTIHKILVYDKDMYIGGSGGLLLRHTPEYTHIYETKTKDDIKQIEIVKHKKLLSINVFTKDKLIIYQDVTWYTKREEIEIPDVGEVFVDSDLIYIPFRNGLIKKLGDNSMKKAPDLKGPIRSFIHCSDTTKLALVVPEDKLLYTTSIKEPRKLRLVGGPLNIQGVKRMLKRFIVCYSRRDVWLLNSSFKIMHNITFKDIILFVEVFEGFVAVVDICNTVHMVSLMVNEQWDGRTIYTHSFDGAITSLAFIDHNVYVSVDNQIVVIKYNF